ncbi:hypothetical protein [Neorhizobium sp. T6_25]|uniref:hypothetical protein n=1 Tax=Neorhizobium sp. T6_25 TaxID=2093833 RepID=UPI00155E5776|nr:hypothetical protein [Neorhizobium sp. T6_25]
MSEIVALPLATDVEWVTIGGAAKYGDARARHVLKPSEARNVTKLSSRLCQVTRSL